MLPPPPGAGVSEGAGEPLGEVVVAVVGVVVGVVLLGALLPPPHPTANTSMVAPPKTANAILASDLIRSPLLFQVSLHTPALGYANELIFAQESPATKPGADPTHRTMTTLPAW